MKFLVPLLLPEFKQPRGAKGEEALCFEIANWLREQTLCHKFPYIWFHIPNEWGGAYKGRHGASQTWMGRVPGAPDYVFVSKKKTLFVEVKTKNGHLSDNQQIFQEWCRKKKVPYHICRSLEELQEILGEAS